MPLLVHEDIPIQEKVDARSEIGEGATDTAATHDTDLYKSFLNLPVPVVLLTLWLVGVVFIGFCAMTLYDLVLPLVEALAGS